MQICKKTKIALVNPNNRGSYRSNYLTRENLGLGYLASWLIKNNCEVRIYDARLEKKGPDIIAKDILSFGPDVVGVSLIVKEASYWTRRLTEYLKDGGIKAQIVMGNYFPSLQPKRALDLIPEANYIVKGEGELSLLGLVQRINKKRNLTGIEGIFIKNKIGKIYFTGRGKLISNLDFLPFPYRYADENQITEISIEGSRGCFYNCTFCAIPCHFDADPRYKWRARSADHIIAEIIQLRKRYPNINIYRFVDPDFIGYKKTGEKRVLEFAKLVIKHRLDIKFYIETRSSNVEDIKLWEILKKAGLRQVYIGVETGSPKIKRMMDKKSYFFQDEKAIALLRSIGINTQYGFMMFTPWTTEKDILLNIRFIKQIGYAGLDKFFQEMNLVPGTKALELAQEIETIFPDGDTGYYTYNLPPIVDRLRKIGRMFEDAKYVYFLERIWFLYKDIQYLSQLGISKTDIFKNNLNDLNFHVFTFCLKSARKAKSSDDNILISIVEQCIEKFIPKIKLLEEKLNLKIHFLTDIGHR
ncbi:MAG: radical SAM protein [Candidatus Pacebacteria bacterium]|nr:radical SAM protein [Candidatus Paceibacterota bacterium]